MEAGSTPVGAPELITGVIMSARPQFYRIAIWTRQAEDPVEEAESGSVGSRLLEIGKHMKTSILGYDLHQKVGSGGLTSEVEFQSHKESKKKKGKKFVAVSGRGRGRGWICALSDFLIFPVPAVKYPAASLRPANNRLSSKVSCRHISPRSPEF